MEIVTPNDLEDTNCSVMTIILHLENKQCDGLLLSCDREITEDVQTMHVRLSPQTSRLSSFYLRVQSPLAYMLSSVYICFLYTRCSVWRCPLLRLENKCGEFSNVPHTQVRKGLLSVYHRLTAGGQSLLREVFLGISGDYHHQQAGCEHACKISKVTLRLMES